MLGYVKVSKYILAGLDFIFDREGNPWFIEANYWPGTKTYTNVIKDLSLMQELGRLMGKCSEPAVLSRIRDRKTVPESGRWHYELLKRYAPDLRLCYTEHNRNSKSYLVDREGHSFRPDCIFKYDQPLQSSFEKEIVVINANSVGRIVNDKFRCLRVVGDAGINVPATLVVKNQAEVRKVLTHHPKLFREGFVLKPNDLTEGEGVQIFKKGESIPKIKEKELLEQRIVPCLHHRSYWNVRTLVVNGKFVGGMIRESRSRVTNIALGAHARKIPRKMIAQLRKPSLAVVKAIDDYAH